MKSTLGYLGEHGADSGASASTPSGTSAGDIMGGIGAILAPLMTAGVGIYAAQQRAEMLKSQARQAPGISYAPSYPAPIPQKSPVLIIVIGLVGLMVVGGMMFMMMSKKGGPTAAYAPPPQHAPPPAVPFAYQPAPPPPPQIRRRRRRKRRPR